MADYKQFGFAQAVPEKKDKYRGKMPKRGGSAQKAESDREKKRKKARRNLINAFKTEMSGGGQAAYELYKMNKGKTGFAQSGPK